jgi:hypothetical protein
MEPTDQQKQEAELILGFLISSAIFSVISGDQAKDAYRTIQTLVKSLPK